MRRGEIVGLKWSDLDRSTSRLSIWRTLQNVGGRPVEFGAKTLTSRRTVDLDHHTMRQLDGWLGRLHRDGPPPHGPDDWMFRNVRGRFLNPESVSELFERIVRRCGLPRIRFHDLRHTYASLLVAAGVPIKVVSERLGHAHPAFTMHTSYRPVRTAVSRLIATTIGAACRGRAPRATDAVQTRRQPATGSHRARDCCLPANDPSPMRWLQRSGALWGCDYAGAGDGDRPG
jgi:integrase